MNNSGMDGEIKSTNLINGFGFLTFEEEKEKGETSRRHFAMDG